MFMEMMSLMMQKHFQYEHAEVTDIDNKDDDYFANVGNYNNIYEYNNDQLTCGDYSNLV